MKYYKEDLLAEAKALPEPYRSALAAGMKKIPPSNRLSYVRKYLEVHNHRRNRRARETE